MDDIKAVYIIDDDGDPFFQEEIYNQGSEEINHAILSNIIVALQNLASEIGSGDVQKIVIGKNQVFTLKDSVSNYRFILRGSEKLKEKRAKAILTQIMNCFVNIFTGNFYKDKKVLASLKSKFSSELDKIFNDYDNASDFLLSL
ncbi:MAG: hypothetical protein BAJALOKI1v1_1820003 [Promethearchaeota archaeon]|nr:MAG: hypothetical protein BAJALOKI1v1_1820003 [Candidatus Lokiarchaeota archaeon]